MDLPIARNDALRPELKRLAIDAQGGALKLSRPAFKKLCSLLKRNIPKSLPSTKIREVCKKEAMQDCKPITTKDVDTVERLQSAINPMQSCVSCHIGSKPSGPAITFDNIDKLRKLVQGRSSLFHKIVERLDTSGNKKMPPDRDLSDQERRDSKKFRSNAGFLKN